MAQTKKSKAMEVKADTAPEVVEKVEADAPVETPVKQVKDEAPTPQKPKKKVFGDRDLIPCVSVTQGELFFVGAKSKDLYTFANADYVCEIEYRDLKYAIMTRNKSIFKPHFIVQDKDFIKEFPELEDIYGPMYSTTDLVNMLKLSPSAMKKAVEALPDGAKESLKVIVSKRIQSGQFDSTQRVKILDEIFGTNMLLMLVD